MTRDGFLMLMNTIAEGWNTGNVRMAADCFSENAIYQEPPDKQLYYGRAALYEFFGGDAPPVPPMLMTWHHLIFDEAQQLGAGEYTFQMNHRYHGLVIVKITGDTISHWREYQYPSSLDWADFAGGNQF
jgi:hypothetical protein